MTARLMPSRRDLLEGAAAAAVALLAPRRLRAQEARPIKLGSLVPLTAEGGPDGNAIKAAQSAVIDEVNEAGGLLGRKIELVVEDDPNGLEATLRAARKLIDEDKVAIIMGLWTSADVTAIAPLCWDAKIMVLSLAAADSLTQLPHQGYLARTQPSTTLQGRQFGNFAVGERARHVFIMMPATPFTDSTIKNITAICEPQGIKVSSLVYDAKKTGYRVELDEVMRAKPDMLVLGGYQSDTVMLAKEAYRAEYKGKIVGFAYAIGPQFVEKAGVVVADGVYAIGPVAAVGSRAYARLRTIMKTPDLDTYVCQGYDAANLAILAMAWGKDPTGKGIRDNLRKIGDLDGVEVDNALDGLKAIRAGKAINYEGASGPCKFAANGDIAAANFRVTVVRGGAIETYKML
jgi:branched-chain amino acid transport system substrate-binding protein